MTDNDGRRTGQVMPDNVRRDSDGFESPGAFFHSPATEAPGTSRSIMTTMSRSVLKNRAANTTHATGRGGIEGDYSTPAPNRRGGKMAALAAGSDDDVPDDDDLGIGESPTLPNRELKSCLYRGIRLNKGFCRSIEPSNSAVLPLG